MSALRTPEEIRELFSKVGSAFAKKPFVAHRMFRGAHAQTLGAYAWPRRARLKPTVARDEERYFQVDEDIQVLAHCRWQPAKNAAPTMVIWHGMEGSTDSVYMWSTADKGFRAGFNVVRVNYRNCGGTEHLTPTLYHGGLSDDLKRVVEELIKTDELKRLYVIGFSLGGNMVLKLLGEYAEQAPEQIVAACAISPSVDLKASSEQILKRSNWIYHQNFVVSMKRRMRLKSRLYPDKYDSRKVDQIRSLRDFDEQFTSRLNGFENADDYYLKASSIRVIEQIRVPTLIIHAVDDPFIPFEPLVDNVFSNNPHLMLVKTDRGGHVAFVSADNATEDRFWAENRAVEFCKLCEEKLTSGSA